MSDKIFSTYTYDIALEDGVGARLVAWVTGLIVFFATLALALNFALSTVTDHWVSGLSGSLTVEIKPPLTDAAGMISPQDFKAFDEARDKILWLAKQHPAVAQSRALTENEIRSLVAPWLGDEAASKLRLPAIIDIKLAPNADTAKLQSDIKNLVPVAEVDTHDDTLDDVKTVVAAARMFVLLLTLAIALLAVVAISGIVNAKFSIHHQEVETLHLIGASDSYIARQFRRHALKGTLQGALIGLGAMLGTLALVVFATRHVQTAVLPTLSLTLPQWAMLFILPLVAGSVIAHLTAERAVMKALAQMP